MKKMLLLAFAIVLLPLAAGAKRTASVEVGGFEFPKQIGAFKLQKTVDFEKERPGLGTALLYDAPNVKATVFVYNNGIGSLPEGVDAAPVTKQFENAKEEIKKTFPDVQLIVRGEKAIVGGVPYLHAAGKYTEDDSGGKNLIFSHLYLTSRSGNFVKLRVSALGTDPEAAIRYLGFVEGVSAAIASAQK